MMMTLQIIPEDTAVIMTKPVMTGDWTQRSTSSTACLDQDEEEITTARCAPIINNTKLMKELQKQWELATHLVQQMPLPSSSGEWETPTSTTTPSSSCMASASTSTTATSTTNKKKTVRFGTIAIRRYDCTLGDHPSVRHGLPLCLDWTWTVQPTILVDDYEDMKHDEPCQKPHRVLLRRMHLTKQVRANIISSLGIPLHEQKQVKQDIVTIQRQRYVSSLLWPVDHVHAVLQRKLNKKHKNRNKGGLFKKTRNSTVVVAEA